jgi:hypothetical protein
MARLKGMVKNVTIMERIGKTPSPMPEPAGRLESKDA